MEKKEQVNPVRKFRFMKQRKCHTPLSTHGLVSNGVKTANKIADGFLLLFQKLIYNFNSHVALLRSLETHARLPRAGFLNARIKRAISFTGKHIRFSPTPFPQHKI